MIRTRRDKSLRPRKQNKRVSLYHTDGPSNLPPVVARAQRTLHPQDRVRHRHGGHCDGRLGFRARRGPRGLLRPALRAALQIFITPPPPPPSPDSAFGSVYALLEVEHHTTDRFINCCKMTAVNSDVFYIMDASMTLAANIDCTFAIVSLSV